MKVLFTSILTFVVLVSTGCGQSAEEKQKQREKQKERYTRVVPDVPQNK